MDGGNPGLVRGGALGVVSQILAAFPPRVATPSEDMLEHVRSALGRNLRLPRHCAPHSRLMTVAGGGPSLEDTLPELVVQQGKGALVATVNAGLSHLLANDVTPWACGILDARAHIADLIEPHPDVFYYVASIAHPSVFEKLKACKVVLWHPGGLPGLADVLPENTPMIGGGSTMGLRWLTIGHFQGFRRFAFHGLDSSYRAGRTHAYDDARDNKGRTPDSLPGEISIDGYRTDTNFLEQVSDYIQLREMFALDVDQPEIRLHGAGLLQHIVTKRGQLLGNPPRRPADKPLNIICVATGDYCGRGAEYVEHLRAGVTKWTKDAHRFHVITEGPASWWAKMQLFEPGRFEGRCVYFDLDTVITGPLDGLMSYDGPFAGLRDVWQPGQMGSGVMTWTAGELDHVWKAWVAEGKPMDDPRGDQAFITRHAPLALRLQDLFPGQFASWKANCGGMLHRIKPGVNVVYFHGQPRPHETPLWNN